jgi:predicted ATPase/DNA-binding CsgD family transcriptional regulator
VGNKAAGVLGGLHGFVPSLTSLIGRVADVRDITDLVGQYRLVTVIGPGGVGKTRVAGEVAQRAGTRFADGAWLVELATVRDPGLVPAAVAAALGIRQAPGTSITASLRASLTRQQALLVLDNCEHVLTAVAELCGELLPAADDVRVLATSREPIGMAGETRFRLSPLPVPGPGERADAAVPAVALFADRARRADPRFALDDDSLALAGRLVARLDGMPLAIELAAARVEVLGLSQLLERIEDRFLLLTSKDQTLAPRHRSLSATVEWSYQSLSQTEQQTFRRIAAFSGPFTLQAAAAVAGAGTEPTLLRLVDCSLLAPPRLGPDGRSRYLMLETLRAFGRDQLAAAGESGVTFAVLAAHALAVAEQAAAQRAVSPGELAGARWLVAEDATLRQALDWALRHDAATAARLSTALLPWWILRGRGTEGYALLRAAAAHAAADDPQWASVQYHLGLAAVSTGDVTAGLRYFTAACERLATAGPSPELARALCGRADILVLVLGRSHEGEQDARRALAMAEATGDPASAALALVTLSQAAYFADDFAAAVEWARQARQIDPDSIPGELVRERSLRLSAALIEAGQLAAARDSCPAAVDLARAADDLSAETFGLLLLARLEGRAGAPGDAWSRLSAALELATRIGDRRRLRMCLPLGAEICATTGRWAEAVTVWSAYLMIMRDNELAETARGAERRQEMLQRAEQVLGPERTREARERGALMTLGIATEFLLLLAEPSVLLAEPSVPLAGSPLAGSGLPVTPAGNKPRRSGALSAREQELVTLVAQGQTDAQIAGELFISVSTVRSHLDRIRDKTSCRRRADLTRLALEEGLI